MYKDSDQQFSFDTEILRKGAYISGLATNPEALPIYLTTAFNVGDLDELFDRYRVDGYCYNRIKNPNRSALAELLTYLEGGEDSIICSSGMAAITTSVLSVVKTGDHILSDQTLYGETYDFFDKILSKLGVETTYVDFTNLEIVKASIRPNTKILYTETVSNPMITVVDIDALADIAHKRGALLFVDNTFMSPYAIRPIEHGADITINSLTKFGNGHSDTVAVLQLETKLIEAAYSIQILW